MKKYLLLIFISVFLSSNIVAAPKKGKTKTKTSASTKANKNKKRQYVDLEGLDIMGLIDRPRTLYIIKKSEISFRDNFADYDYVDAIIEPTYGEPF